jgi:hypothetical protein
MIFLTADPDFFFPYAGFLSVILGIIPTTMIILKFAAAIRQYMRFRPSKKILLILFL